MAHVMVTTAMVTTVMVTTGRNGAQGRNRTTDTVIFSHVLYQLSYLGPDALRRRPGTGSATPREEGDL